MLYRLSPVNAIKQLSWFTIGMGEFIFLVVFLPHIRKFGRLKYAYVIIAIILLALPLFLGSEIKGSKNWIRFGSFGIQPSEIAKLFIIFYLASALQNIKNFLDVIKTAIPVFIGIAFLVIEKDLGASLIFFGIFITMLYISTSNFKYILAGIGAFLGGGVLSYLMFSHIRIRFKIWIDPWKYINGSGYQICQSLIAIATGGLFGTGIGLGHPYLIPEAHNDFIFAAICEEFGLLGGIALILLYLMLIYRGLRTALHARDGYSMLVAVGISSMIAFQVFVIIGGVIKLIPLTGITLPFVSYGGSSMILNFASLGVLQKISESGRKSI
jgi:cell division protein FtsW (lipid II flippase)